jgi:hypothetical protein
VAAAALSLHRPHIPKALQDPARVNEDDRVSGQRAVMLDLAIIADQLFDHD